MASYGSQVQLQHKYLTQMQTVLPLLLEPMSMWAWPWQIAHKNCQLTVQQGMLSDETRYQASIAINTQQLGWWGPMQRETCIRAQLSILQDCLLSAISVGMQYTTGYSVALYGHCIHMHMCIASQSHSMCVSGVYLSTKNAPLHHTLCVCRIQPVIDGIHL